MSRPAYRLIRLRQVPLPAGVQAVALRVGAVTGQVIIYANAAIPCV